MLKISKMTDYAIVLLTELARDPKHNNLSAADLSVLTRLPLPTVQVLLKKLAHGDLLTGLRGRDGGYQLAKPLTHITVYDVLLLMEGAMNLTDCSSDNHDTCHLESHCHLVGRWQKVNRLVMDSLRAISLADLLVDDKVFYKDNKHRPTL